MLSIKETAMASAPKIQSQRFESSYPSVNFKTSRAKYPMIGPGKTGTKHPMIPTIRRMLPRITNSKSIALMYTNESQELNTFKNNIVLGIT
jgi:hypothetical protein